MSFNKETFDLMLKLALGMVGILLLIWLIAVFTPKLAKFIDKIFGKAKIDPGPSSITLENGSVLTLRRTGAAPSQSVDIDTSRINVRELTAEEGARFFGMDGVSGTGYFDREDNSLIGFSGQTESGVRIHLSVQDKFPRDVVIMSNREALIALGDGVTGFGGYFVTDANSRGERNAIYYAALCFGEVNVYLEAGGTLAESEMTKAELTAAINALVRQGRLSFDATEVD